MNSKRLPRPELDEAIRIGWAAGHSASVIGRGFGVTKNVVISRSRILRMPPRPSPLAPDSPTRHLRKGHTASGQPVIVKVPVLRVKVPPRLPAPVRRSEALDAWVALSPPVPDPGQGCQFPMWADAERIPRPALYCGAERHGSIGAYCSGHHSVSYTARALPVSPIPDNADLA